MRSQFGATVTSLLDEDPRTALVLAEISETLFEGALARHPNRALNVGIMEQTMVGVAAGFAMEGFHPFAHSISPFMAERPYEQLKLDFGYQGLGGTFVGVGGSYDYGAEGGTHHSPADVSLMLAIPGMEVLIPGHTGEVDGLLRATYANGRPTYVRLSVAANAEPMEVAPGRMEIVRPGTGATVLAIGPMLSRTLAACEGLDVSVLYVTSARPFDRSTLASVAGDAPTVITVEPCYEGTFTSEVVGAVGHRPSRVHSIGVPRVFIHSYGTPAELDSELELDAAGIRRRIETFLGA
ncbi:MAG: transketolase C-terminal domain-containing protein [Actinomycetota bacterium]